MPHLGTPNDWHADGINRAYLPELGGDALAFIEDIEELPGRLTFADRVALAAHRRRPELPLQWLSGEIAHEPAQVLYIGSPGSTAKLLCGIALHISSRRRQHIEAPADIAAAADEPLVLIGRTGLWLDVGTSAPSVTEEVFHAQGEKLARRLLRKAQT